MPGTVELAGHADLFALTQLGDDVLLGREVEEERAVGDTDRLDDGRDIGVGHARRLELGDRRLEQPLAGGEPLASLVVTFSLVIGGCDHMHVTDFCQ